MHQLWSSHVQRTLQEHMRKMLDAMRSCEILVVRLNSVT